MTATATREALVLSYLRDETMTPYARFCDTLADVEALGLAAHSQHEAYWYVEQAYAALEYLGGYGAWKGHVQEVTFRIIRRANRLTLPN